MIRKEMYLRVDVFFVSLSVPADSIQWYGVCCVVF